MKTKNLILIVTALFAITISSCRRSGCTEPRAINFDAKAQVNDHSCLYDNGYGNYGGGTTGGNNNQTTLTVWTNGHRQLDVWVGYIDSGKITGNRSSVPSCSGENGCFHTQKINSGSSYSIEAQDADYSWKMDIQMNSGCNTVLLDQTGLGKMDPFEGQNVTVIKMVKKEKSGYTRFIQGIKNLVTRE